MLARQPSRCHGYHMANNNTANANETSTMNTAQLKEALERIAASTPYSVQFRNGIRKWHKDCYADVKAQPDGSVEVTIKTSYSIDEIKAKEILGKIRSALSDLEEAKNTFWGRKLTQGGFRHMGRFEVTSLTSTHYPTGWTSLTVR